MLQLVTAVNSITQLLSTSCHPGYVPKQTHHLWHCMDRRKSVDGDSMYCMECLAAELERSLQDAGGLLSHGCVSYSMAGVGQRQAGRIFSKGRRGGHGQVGGMQGEGTPMAGRWLREGAHWARAQGSRGCERVPCSSAGWPIQEQASLFRDKHHFTGHMRASSHQPAASLRHHDIQERMNPARELQSCAAYLYTPPALCFCTDSTGSSAPFARSACTASGQSGKSCCVTLT